MLDWLDVDLLGKIGIAVLCGGAIGLERELSDKPAGLRTNILICTGAMLFTVASVAIAGERSDPGRIAAGVVAGVGFLGAGTIIQSRGLVHGLTSAATIWVVAAIGVWIGAGRYAGAVTASAMVLLVLWFLRNPEKYIARRVTVGRLCLEMEDSADLLNHVIRVFHKHGMAVGRIRTSPAGDERVRVALPFPVHHKQRGRILAELRETAGIHSASETIL